MAITMKEIVRLNFGAILTAVLIFGFDSRVSAQAPRPALPTELRIVSPEDGAIVPSGQTLIVRIEAQAGLRNVFLVGGGPIGFARPPLNAPPYEFKIKIPSGTTAGVNSLAVMGVVRPGETIVSHISIDIERPDPPVRLVANPLFFRGVGDESRVTVIGTFADHTTADLTYSTLISYVSANPAIATVDKTGTVKSIAPGSTKIVINGRVFIPITVPNKRM
jgi:hypothetical protein